ncbi:reverse transcriptase domain-containing protein [Thiolapillus sp.]|uniref:reverse transcriptase domain-containing protein n=1 Tax=Thiolapillus sp. TaxID=2017437 RepID=UPI003AF65F1E
MAGSDGSLRPIQLQNIEDKIVQSATAEILNSIYESDFAAFSYGFRPGKSQHQALQALQTVLQKGKVNWVLDLDLKGNYSPLR